MAAAITYEQLNVLNAAYAACIDEDRLESWPDFFVDTCLYLITTAENYQQGMPAGLVYADSKGMLKDRISALRDANIYERQRYRHIVSMPSIIGSDEKGLAAETPFLVARIMRGGKTDLFATGKYVDRIARGADGALKLAQRIVVCDSVSFDTLLAIPL
ncbi:MAG TPA: terephthalate 1,2-dioxygenase [Oxalobacteraceae bacterium]|nr:terephthalate 1,2-dioxygenase [Oxalobacteraceae bacterium]